MGKTPNPDHRPPIAGRMDKPSYSLDELGLVIGLRQRHIHDVLVLSRLRRRPWLWRAVRPHRAGLAE